MKKLKPLKLGDVWPLSEDCGGLVMVVRKGVGDLRGDISNL